MKKLFKTTLIFLRIKIQKLFGKKICPQCTRGMKRVKFLGYICKCGYRKTESGKEYSRSGEEMINVTEMYKSGNRKTRRIIKSLEKKGKLRYI